MKQGKIVSSFQAFKNIPRLKTGLIASLALSILVAGCSVPGLSTNKPGATPTSQLGVGGNTSSNNNSSQSVSDFQQQIENTVSRVQPTIVEILSTQAQGQALGSGEIVSKDGYILTNDHVIQGSQQLQVILPNGNTFPAQIAGASPADDIAVIKINANNLPVISFGDSSKVQVGQFALAIGNPLGLGQSVTFGIISAVGRTVTEPSGPANVIPNMLQTSAEINPGNSGGALVDINGNLIGIPTLAATDPEFGNSQAQGIGFAIPINRAKFIADQLITTGHVTNTGRAYMGVSVVSVTADLAQFYSLPVNHGAYIQSTVSGGPADKAGMKQADIITSIDGTTVNNVQDLESVLANKNPGDTITITYQRGQSSNTAKVTLGQLPAQ